jgi:hypothetical protein
MHENCRGDAYTNMIIGNFVPHRINSLLMTENTYEQKSSIVEYIFNSQLHDFSSKLHEFSSGAAK